jgi:hypothetical protein
MYLRAFKQRVLVYNETVIIITVQLRVMYLPIYLRNFHGKAVFLYIMGNKCSFIFLLYIYKELSYIISTVSLGPDALPCAWPPESAEPHRLNLIFWLHRIQIIMQILCSFFKNLDAA